jgi:hypothetical protein
LEVSSEPAKPIFQRYNDGKSAAIFLATSIAKQRVAALPSLGK